MLTMLLSSEFRPWKIFGEAGRRERDPELWEVSVCRFTSKEISLPAAEETFSEL
jgi:hypothetical protein